MSLLLPMYPGDAWAFLVANVLVQVTVVILMARLLARLGSRWNAAWRHSIYLVALLCVLASPVLSWMMQATGITLVTLRPPVPSAPPVEPASIPMAKIAEPGPVERPAASQAMAGPVHRDTENVSQAPEPETPSVPPFPDILRAIGGGAVVIWLLGVALLVARWCHGLRLIAVLRRAAQPLDSEAMAELLRQVRRALGTDRLPPLATSASLDRPIMVGVIRPLVILPQEVLRTLPESELADVLVHECAHAVCRHQIVSVLQRLAATLFWPHPLVRLLNRALARAREEVCDNYVLRRSAAPRYARTLLELSQLLVGVSPKPTALGLFHCQWRLEDRVADLLDRRRKVMTRVNRWTAAALTVTFLMLGLLVAATSVVQAATIERRAVNKRIRDFPERTDLSTPESAMAALNRNFARKDMQAALGLSWVKMEPDVAQNVEDCLKHDPSVKKTFGQLILDAEIVEVLTYHDDLAAVIYKFSLPKERPYDWQQLYGRINGTWMGLGVGDPYGSSPTVQAAAEGFEKEKDDLWRKFVEIRNDVKAGRTVMYDKKRVAATGAPMQRRAVNKLAKDFPEKTDLSTPESAMAASCQRWAQKGITAALEVSWVQLDAQMAKEIEYALKHDPNGPKKDYRRIFHNAEIIDVLTYRDDFAVVIYKESGGGAVPYGGVLFGKINGVWKSFNLGLPLDDSPRDLLLPSVKAIAERLDRMKDDYWRLFVEVRNDLLNGRTLTFDAKVRVAPANARKPKKTAAEKAAPPPVTKNNSPPLSLSTIEKENLKGGNRETWRVDLALNMPSLEPPAVLCAIVDKDPVPAFLARFKSLPVPTPEQLAHVRYTPAQFRVTQMRAAWNMVFTDLAGKNYQLLTQHSDGKSSPAGIMSSGPESKRWIITKTVDINRQPVCWCIPVEVKTGERTEVTLSQSNTFDLQTACAKEPMGATVHLVLPGAAKKVLKKLVDDSIRKRFPEITSRETMEWGEVVKAANGNSSIGYKYLAKIQGKDTKIMYQVFTFDANGQFVSAKDLDGFPRNW